MDLIGMILPNKKSEPEVATIINTGWGGTIALAPQRLTRRDRSFVVAEFQNGSKFRSVKTYTDQEVPTLITEIAKHVQTHNFPWRDVRGERQWVRLDPDTITL